MGATSSRPSPATLTRRRRPASVRRTLSSLLSCGASSSRSPIEVEDYPPQLLVNSAEHSHQEKFKFPLTDSACDGCDLTGCKPENAVPTGKSIVNSEGRGLESSPRGVEEGDKGKGLSESTDLAPPHEPLASFKSLEIADTSYLDRPSGSVSENRGAEMDAMNGANRESSQACLDLTNSWSSPFHQLQESALEEAIDYFVSDSGSDSVASGVIESPGRDTVEELIPSSSGFIFPERERNRQDTTSVLHIGLMSISSNVVSGTSAETSSHEARRISRILSLESVSGHGSNRHTDSRTFLFSSDDSDHMRSEDRWHLDLSSDFLNNVVGVDLRSHGSLTRDFTERRRDSRSEIWQRLSGGSHANDRQPSVCPRGIHPGGQCLCEPSVSADDSGARSGISRIIMLAEALFEVLDEVHRQPLLRSMSMLSLPAPEPVVNSFPVKTHRKQDRNDSEDAVLQCYICLADYEEGDKIRVLPCQHEYHMSCVDKWLKEIHGVCPLCRRDVCEGSRDGSASNSEIPSTQFM